jgi:hypothetical protein
VAADVGAVHVAEANVEQDEVWALLDGDFESLLSRAARGDYLELVARRGEDAFNAVGYQRVIISDQD